MKKLHKSSSLKLHRSVLFVPAINQRAQQKLAVLHPDAVIFDFEDSVESGEKQNARENLIKFLTSDNRPDCTVAIRINALDTIWGTDDLAAAAASRPDAIVLPKVETQADILSAYTALDVIDPGQTIKLWAMIETPRAIININSIADMGITQDSRLNCLIVGPNDLAKETRIQLKNGRRNLVPLLLQVVLAGRAANLMILDGVSNNFNDMEAFAAECAQGRELGFDGKTLIHPAQIDIANHAFAPSKQEISEARTIVSEFSKPENQALGVISINGQMVERLHLEMAQDLLKTVMTLGEKNP